MNLPDTRNCTTIENVLRLPVSPVYIYHRQGQRQESRLDPPYLAIPQRKPEDVARA